MRDVLSVYELVQDLRAAVEDRCGNVWVEGELSNFHRARSGHCYFTVKDAEAQLDCVMWRHLTQHVFFEPEDGMQLRLHGAASVYERRGRLQLLVESMQPAGEGAWRRAFEALKRRLEAEGLFDPARKRPLPPLPEAIGLVTSGAGAALHDMQTVLARRLPQVRVVLASVPVQGRGAADRIAAAVRAFNRLPKGHPQRPDLLLVGRGGGSTEDLWAFNEEVVTRALFASEIPTVSGVGHETDVSIADLVPDCRAATPTMAAELAVPDRREMETHVRGLFDALDACVRGTLAVGRRRVETLRRSRGLHRPAALLRQRRRQMDDLAGRLRRAGGRLTERPGHRLDALRHRLRTLDPEWPLRRGYACVEREGRPVRTAAQLQTGERVTLRFRDGTRPATVGAAPVSGAEQPRDGGGPEEGVPRHAPTDAEDTG